MGESSNPRIILIGTLVGSLTLAFAQFYTITNLRAVESKLAAVEAEQAKAKDVIAKEVDKVRSTATDNAQDRQKALAAMRDEVEETRTQVRGIAGQVKQETQKSVQDLNTRIAANEQQLQQTHAQVSTEISGLKQDASTATTEIAAVNTEIRDVREQVADTRGQLNATISDLKRVTGDMGVISGLIATNGQQIEALKQLGDRNYAEFTIPKAKTGVRVGDIWVTLRDINTGKNRYTIELRADDRKIEKKDRGINEPVQFYVGKNRQPYELVVNQIQKNVIIGYLATPKVTATR